MSHRVVVDLQVSDETLNQLAEKAKKNVLAMVRIEHGPNIVISEATQAWIDMGATMGLAMLLLHLSDNSEPLDESLTSE
jgi:hypothetical protein